MKTFFHKYSYSIFKMFINQFAISIFGTVLAMATSAAQNDVLTLIVSIFAILFYLFLIYTMVWEIGGKDRISVDAGKKEYRPHTGLVMGLIANIPNFIFAILYSIGYPFMRTHKWAGTLNAIIQTITVIFEGMYLGISIVLPFGAGDLEKLNRMWWTYFVIIIPALVTSWVAYYLGHKNFRFMSLFTGNKNETKNK